MRAQELELARDPFAKCRFADVSFFTNARDKNIRVSVYSRRAKGLEREFF